MIATAVNTHYSRFVELVRSLHSLIAQGRCDSPEADSLREEMDQHARYLNESERERLDGLSADLYSLTGNEIQEPGASPVGEPELRAAWETGDYDRLLVLLRRPAPFLAEHDLAFMRGHCWAQAGDLETALLFYQRAHELRPQDEQLIVMLMLTYLGLYRLEDAQKYAIRLANDPTVTTPIILLRAAGVLFASQEELPNGPPPEAFKQVVHLIASALRLDETSPPEKKLRDSDRAKYLAISAFCSRALGETKCALEASRSALRLDPTDESVRSIATSLAIPRRTETNWSQEQRALGNRLATMAGADRFPLQGPSFMITNV